MKPALLFISVLILICSACPVSSNKETDIMLSEPREHEHILLFYNVENLFHPSDDTIRGDDPYTPVGERYWTYKRYRKKISTICKVILAAGEWEPPVFIGLCEIENEKVIRDLVFHPLLRNYNYKFIHRESPDHRGIDVALLFRPGRVSLLKHHFIINKLPGRESGTRDILHGEFTLGKDTLDIFINHWTSKYGGAFETEELRLYQAGLLSSVVDTLLQNNPNHKVLLAGDFNDNSNSVSLKYLCRSGQIQEILPKNVRGSYKYQGKWDLIDHVFIAGSWSKNTCSTEMFQTPYLLEADEKYTGVKPYRTYTGFTYNGGVSDHLPLLFYFDPGEDPVD